MTDAGQDDDDDDDDVPESTERQPDGRFQRRAIQIKQNVR